MFVTVGLVLVLENLRPRRRDPEAAAPASREDAMPPRRRSA